MLQKLIGRRVVRPLLILGLLAIASTAAAGPNATDRIGGAWHRAWRRLLRRQTGSRTRSRARTQTIIVERPDRR